MRCSHPKSAKHDAMPWKRCGRSARPEPAYHGGSGPPAGQRTGGLASVADGIVASAERLRPHAGVGCDRILLPRKPKGTAGAILASGECRARDAESAYGAPIIP
jgi:hypothetical protein